MSTRFVLAYFSALTLGVACSGWSTAHAEPELTFSATPESLTRLSLAKLRDGCPERVVRVEDPYHGRSMRYFAMSLSCVLDLGFADVGGSEGLRGQGLLLKALDGYTRPVFGGDLLEPGAALAYGEVDRMRGPNAPPLFTPIDRRKVDPAPFYLVWSGVEQNDPHTHPWPYQLARIEIASFAEAFPRTTPAGLDADDPGWRGYAIFQRSCAACHAINGEGGKIGPDLNVPKSIVEYRPIEQIKGYIRDPEATRYTNMPGHPDLGEADLEALIDYFRAMSDRKQDPRDEPRAAAKP